MMNEAYEAFAKELGGQRKLAMSVDCRRCFREKGGKMNVRMFLCPVCGNKRCPTATDHRHACTHSNEPGQPGSDY